MFIRRGIQTQKTRAASASLLKCLGLAAVLSVVLGAAPARAALKVETTFLYDLQGPTRDSRFNQHNAIYLDFDRNELYVVDTGNHCIRIFGKEGIESFEFGRDGRLTVPLGVAVNSLGDIYVLQSDGGRRPIEVFDFRGRYLDEFKLQGLPEGDRVDPTAIAVDSRDVLYVSDPKHGRLLAFDGQGILKFSVSPDMSEKDREEVVFGNLMIDKADRVYLPISTLGIVYVFDPEGRLVMSFGIKGGGPGKLAFPIDVVMDNGGRLLVLDKQRHCISVWTPDGKYLTEFGGLGTSPGWFYYPSGLEMDRYGRIYVSQRYKERVQVLKVKEEVE